MQVIVAVSDLDRSLAFYERAFGWPRNERIDDLEEATTRVEEAGGRLLSSPALRSWGEIATWYADPDGNVVALAASAAPSP